MLDSVFSWNKREIRNNLLFAFLFFFKFFVYDISMVPSGSMTPTFLTGDLVVVNKHHIRWSLLNLPWGGVLGIGKKGWEINVPPARGTPCVFTRPRDARTYYLKRLVAFEGETVQMKNGILHINDKPVTMTFVKTITILNDQNRQEKGKVYKITLENGKSYHIYRRLSFGKGRIDNTPKYRVPKGHVWVQGDNHTGSVDSFTLEFQGPLPAAQLISTPVYVIVNSNSRGEVRDWSQWILSLPYLIFKYIYNINFSRMMFAADRVD